MPQPPVALVGSGEFLEPMEPVDRLLLRGRPSRAVFLPTAAGQEGEERIQYWLDLGTAHYEGLDVEAVPLPVLDRKDAERSELAAMIEGAGLIYLSGGSPGYLADTLRNTAVWRAILAAFDSGAALAGCSAGACALSAVAGGFRRAGDFSGRGLGVIPQLAVIPHFDRFDSRSPELTGQFLASAPESTQVVGIDEETALVGGPECFSVMGRQSVWWIDRDGSRQEFPAGSSLTLRSGERPEHLDLSAEALVDQGLRKA